MFHKAITTLAGAALLAPIAAAANPVELASDVFVERFQPAPDGRVARVLERADRLRAGDRVVFVVNWRASRGHEFTVTNPLPHAVAFRDSVDEDEVSVDGGRTWGHLGELVIRDSDGSVRRASPEDVTHLRWRVPGAIAALGAGQMTYRGVVR